jgi:hypothetical protein
VNIIEATRGYEKWVRGEVGLVEADLKRKHARMVDGAFPFLRATYYRWAQIWEEAAGDLAKTPKVLSVGDLHIENFGTWRDAEGRLVWGVNDFDEAAVLPVASDLLRLSVSAVLAVGEHELRISRARIAQSILSGYEDGVASGGSPFVLEERHPALRGIARNRLKDAERFWRKLRELPVYKGRQPKPAARLLAQLLPRDIESVRIVHRIAGLGSLGRQRFTAIGELAGGYVAREVKPLTPAGSFWATGRGPRRILYSTIVNRAVRCPDPFLAPRGTWVGRRLSPSNSRIELAELPPDADVAMVLHSMGFETANVHLGHDRVEVLKKAARSIKASDFGARVRALEKAVMADWKDWCRKS